MNNILNGIIIFLITFTVISILIFLPIEIKKRKNKETRSKSTYYTPPSNINIPQPNNQQQTEIKIADQQTLQNLAKITFKEPEKVINYPYIRKQILTLNEQDYYYHIKEVADRYNFAVLSKIRFADIVDVDNYKVQRKDFYYWFNRINKKHIDFALCNPKDLSIIALIELDDYTHERADRQERDQFVDNVCRCCGYNIIHVHKYDNLYDKLTEYGIIQSPTGVIYN